MIKLFNSTDKIFSSNGDKIIIPTIEQLEAISKAKSVKDKTYITQTNDCLPFFLDVEAIKKYEVA